MDEFVELVELVEVVLGELLVEAVVEVVEFPALVPVFLVDAFFLVVFLLFVLLLVPLLVVVEAVDEFDEFVAVVAAEEVLDVVLELVESEPEESASEPDEITPPDPMRVPELPICGGVISKTAPSEQTAPVPIINARFTCSSFLFPFHNKNLYCVVLKNLIVESVFWNSSLFGSLFNSKHKWSWATNIDITISKGGYKLHDVSSIHGMNFSRAH